MRRNVPPEELQPNLFPRLPRGPTSNRLPERAYGANDPHGSAKWMRKVPANQNNRNTLPARRPSDLDGLRVLVVEDSWHVSTGLRMLLEACGAAVDGPVATSADAMRLVSENTPDVAIVDINLRDGEQSYELIDRLQDRGIRIV